MVNSTVNDIKYQKLLADYDIHCQKVIKETVIGGGENTAGKRKRIARLEKQYINWFEYHFPHYATCKSAPYHQKFSNEIIGNKKIKALLEIYRSGAKSVHADMGIPLYLYLVKKDLFFMLLIGDTDVKAKQLLSNIQAELEYNQLLINDYGRKMKRGDWADGNFYTTDGIRFMSLGFGMSPRGLREGARRPDYIVIDDVDTKKHVNNDRIMGESVDYILEEAAGCFDASDNSTERLVFANNNFHRNSITNRLKNEFKKFIQQEQSEIKSNYYIITVPAVKNLTGFEPAWKEKTTADYWRKKYLKRPRSFMREYMHMHVQEGKIFKAAYMQWKQMLPLEMYDALIFTGDLSYKDKGDYKGQYLIGKKGKEFHIIHSFLRQTSRQQAACWLYDLYERRQLSRYSISYKIDGLFAQDEFISDFDREGDERGYYIPVIANKKTYGNKYDHIESIEGIFQRLWVFFNINEKNSLDQMDTIDQFTAFEKGSQAHDDGPDAIAVGFKELDKETFVEKFEPRITKRTPYKFRF